MVNAPIVVELPPTNRGENHPLCCSSFDYAVLLSTFCLLILLFIVSFKTSSVMEQFTREAFLPRGNRM